MEDIKKTFEEKKAQLEQMRDEVALKAHLGKAEAKEEVARLEKELDLFVAKYKPMVKEVGVTAEKTAAALSVAADELKAGYEKVRKML